jgi:hypothetical protein
VQVHEEAVDERRRVRAEAGERGQAQCARDVVRDAQCVWVSAVTIRSELAAACPRRSVVRHRVYRSMGDAPTFKASSSLAMRDVAVVPEEADTLRSPVSS